MKVTMRRPLVVAVLLVAASGLVGGAFAAGHSLTAKRQTAAVSNVLYACVKTNEDEGNNLRMVSKLSDCKKKETGIQWNIVGPQGPAGPQGVPGISVTTTALSAGDSHCATGGIAVTAVSGQSYVCNGPKGDPGVSVTTEQLTAGDVNCPTGGVHIHAVSGESYVCNGAAGAQGPPGPVGPQGPPGASGGAANLTSPNGAFSVEITDHGIYLRGPGGTTYVDRFTAATSSNPNFGR